MADLSTTWLGLDLPTPFVVGASPIADDPARLGPFVDAGASAVILRSVFEEQIVAEQMAVHEFLDSRVDLDAEARSFLPESATFPVGAEPALAHVERVKAAVDVPVVASLNGVTPGGWTDIAARLVEAGADAVELNLYDLATDPAETSATVESRQAEVAEQVVEAVGVPVTVKLSPFYTALPHFVTRLQATGVAGVSVFNRFYQPDIDAENLTLDRHLELSTSGELPLRLHALAVLRDRVDVSLAVTGGVHTGIDAAKALLCGADAVHLVSSLLRSGPAALTLIREGLVAWLDDLGYASVREATGAMSLGNVGDPHGFERVNYTTLLQGWQPR